MPPLPADADYPDPALEGIPTRLGGALFLVNVMSALDLPACFAPAWPLERAVGHWGVLRGLAGALAADLQEDVDSDPIWPALAALCPEPQVDLLDAGAPLAVPEAWRDWAPPEAEPPLPAPSLPAFDRWLAFVAPLLRRRIAMALGVEPADAGSCLLRRHGRLHVDGPHVELVMALDDAGVEVSAGSACAAGSLEPSHVLIAMGLPKEQAKASLRFSVAPATTEEEIDAAAERTIAAVARLRALPVGALGPL
jgi:hypothetical protein